MQYRIKIMTHESIVHSQIVSIEKLLRREITYHLTLNTRTTQSHIVFSATPDEIALVKSNLGYKVYIETDDKWGLVP